MSKVLQFELRAYIENHQFETELQDNGVIAYIPVSQFLSRELGHKFLGNEAYYVETYREARDALGY